MWRLTIGLICWCSACLVSNGAEPEPVADGEAQAITEILKTGWQTSLAAKRKTDAYYRSLVVAGNVTPDIRRAYLLSLIRTRRYPQALRLTESLLDAKPGDGEILRMKVWLSVITKSYDEAMVDADRLADLAGEMTTDAKDQVAWTLFLGRMIGFVEGPASESAPLGLTDRRRRRLERTLAIDLLKQFQTGRKEVLDRHAELVARRDGLVAKSKADADAEREVKLQDLKAERDRLRDRKDDTTKRQSDLEQALQKRLDEAARQLGPLENERARLDAEGAVVHRELGAIAIDIARLESRAAQIRDPVLRERYYFEIRRLDRIAAGYEADAFALERRAGVVDLQRSSVLRDHQISQAQYGQRLKKGADELNKLRKQERRVDVVEKRTRRPTRGLSGQTRSLNAEIIALNTYVPFPVEQEKKKLLGRVGAKR